MNNVAFLGYAIQQADTARNALLRFTIATAVAYHGANVTGGNGAGDEVRAALKSALRDRGENRATADRWVNDACRMSEPLVARFAPDYEKGTVDAIVSDMLSRIQRDASNVGRLAELLGVKKPGKEKEPRGATLAAAIAEAATGDCAGAESAAPTVAAPAPVAPGAGISLHDTLAALVAQFGLAAVNEAMVNMTVEQAKAA